VGAVDVAVNVAALPRQTVAEVPGTIETDDGDGLTDCVRVALVQPLPKVYVIVVVPVATPVTTPVELFIVAVAGVLLLHVPPGVVVVNATVALTHEIEAPVIAAGVWFTVTTELAGVPHPLEYEMVAVPGAMPVTIPVVPPTVATEVLLLVHAPTPPGLDHVVVAPVHTVIVPVLADGEPFTTKVAVALQPAAV
jgi:hypothetical protein